MARIVLRRHEMSLSSNTIGTDALNALLSIPGVSEPEVVEESEEHAVVSYTWVAGAVANLDTEAHFRAFGLRRAE